MRNIMNFISNYNLCCWPKRLGWLRYFNKTVATVSLTY